MKKVIASFVSVALVVTGPGYAAASNKAKAPASPVSAGHSARPVRIEAASLKGIDASKMQPLMGLPPGYLKPGASLAQELAKIQPRAETLATAQAVAPGMVAVLEAVERGEEAGGTDLAAALDAAYSRSKARPDASDRYVFVVTDASPAQTLKPSTKRASVSKRDGADMGPVSITLLGLGGALGVGMIFPRTRNLIMYYGAMVMDKFTSNERIYDKMMKELEEGEAKYNGAVKSARDLMNARQTQLDGLNKELETLEADVKAKVAQVKAAAEGTPAYDAARKEGVEAMNKVNRKKGEIATIEKARDDANASMELAMAERENFFNVKAERAANAVLRMTEIQTGDRKARLAAMFQRYQIEGGKLLEKLTGRANEAKAKGDASMDAVKGSQDGQKIEAENRSKTRKAEDDFDSLLKGDGKSMDPSAGKYLRVASWAIGGVGLFMAAATGYAMLGFGVIVAAGLASLLMKPGAAARRIGADVFIIGAGTALVGLGAAKISTMFGIAITMVGSMTFLAPAFLAATLGLLGASKAYFGMRKAGTLPQQQVVVPEVKMDPPQRFDVFAMINEKVGGFLKKTESKPAADAPAASDVAGRAVEAGKKIADAAGTAAAAGAKQAGAAALNTADKAVDGLEKLAEKAAQAAGDAASQPTAPAPSADEIVGRLRDVGSRLASVGAKVAENQVEKLEKMAGDGPRKGQLVSRAVNAIKGILDMQLQKLESTPEYQAYLARKAVADGEKQFQKVVYDAAYQYYLTQRRIEQSQNESARLAGLIKNLLSPRVNGEAPSAKDEQSARALITAKRHEDLKVIANLKALEVAKVGFEKAVQSRALVMANAVEKMIEIEAGLTQATIGDLTARLKLMEVDYISGMTEISQRFKDEVAKRLAAGDAAGAVSDTDPSVQLAKAEQHVAQLSVDDELARLKNQYSK